jgi:ubiquitin-like protein Pup
MATKDTSGGQSRSTRRTEESDQQDVVEESGSGDLKERHEKLSEDVDSLLDEIDDVLEENAEEFVKGYVQMGGQ